MLKNILKVGKELSKTQQQTVNGGKRWCKTNSDCRNNARCVIPAGCSSGYCDSRPVISPSFP